MTTSCSDRRSLALDRRRRLRGRDGRVHDRLRHGLGDGRRGRLDRRGRRLSRWRRLGGGGPREAESRLPPRRRRNRPRQWSPPTAGGRRRSARAARRVDLPARRRRQVVDELDLARDVLLRERLGDVLAERGRELLAGLVPRLEDDVRPHELAPALEVADPDGRAADRLVPAQRRLDLVGAEGPPAARDHVGRAPDVPEVALLVAGGDVARQVPVAGERALRLVGRVPVAGEERRWSAADGEVAFDPRRKLVPLAVDDRDVVTGQRLPERAGLDRDVRAAVRDDDVRLRLPVPVVDLQAPHLLEERGDVGLEVVAGGDEAAEAVRAVALRGRASGGRRALGTRRATGRGPSRRAGG